MYSLPHFKEKDQKRLLNFMEDHPFALLTGSTAAGKQVATQVPVLVEKRSDELFLQGHLMRNADHHKAFKENSQVLLVFTGPHAYVSSSWYATPPMGSTWNYMTIHAHGQIRFFEGEGLVELMKKLTLRFESNNTASPVIYDHLPQEYLDKMLPGIVGFELKVDLLENVFKLSQNRDEQSYRNIITQLEKQPGNGTQIALEMSKRLDEVFPPQVEQDGSEFIS